MADKKAEFYDLVEKAKTNASLYRQKNAKHNLVLAAYSKSIDRWIVWDQGVIDRLLEFEFVRKFEPAQTRPLHEQTTIDTQAR